MIKVYPSRFKVRLCRELTEKVGPLTPEARQARIIKILRDTLECDVVLGERPDWGRGPIYPDSKSWRYGIEHKKNNPVDDDPRGWFGGWPSCGDLNEAIESLFYFIEGDGRYEARIVAYPPDPEPYIWRMERL